MKAAKAGRRPCVDSGDYATGRHRLLRQPRPPNNFKFLKTRATRLPDSAEPCPAETQAWGLTRRVLLLTTASSAGLISAWPVVATEAQGSSSGITTVFVAGATGSTGRRVVAQLLERGYRVRAGIRDVKKAKTLGLDANAQVALVVADVTSSPSVLADAIGDAQAVISATGPSGLFASSDAVDEQGTKHLVDAAKARGVRKFVMVSSLLTNAPAVGQGDNPTYKFLNLFGKALEHKLAGELYVRASGLNYTIVRPGGLTDAPPGEVGNLVARPEDSLFALDSDVSSRISRDTVAAVAVEALAQASADNTVVEVVASPEAPPLPPDQWFFAAV